jgi:NDP-sugar pyrophosphorylase family protein
VPNPMIEINGRPYIWYIIKTYSHYEVTISVRARNSVRSSAGLVNI